MPAATRADDAATSHGLKPSLGSHSPCKVRKGMAYSVLQMELVLQEGRSGRTDLSGSSRMDESHYPWEEGRPRVCTWCLLHCRLLSVPG